MKKNNLKTILPVFIMIVLTCSGYSIFYNNAFSGYEAQGEHIWLSASTVKFVNNWLKEGPVNLNFIMYEYPASIEFNSYAERGAYISYPPGTIVPVYVLAKVLHKTEIQIRFVKQFLKLKFLFDTILVCLIFYSILMFTLKTKYRNWDLITSVIFALSWMLLPINLYYLRNVYFSDQSIITLVLLFTLLEIFNDCFSKKTLLNYAYLCFKVLISLFGALTDYYFLFVLFISWLVKIIPLFKDKGGLKNVFTSSVPYVLPVFLGFGIFAAQIRVVPNYKDIILNKMRARMIDGSDWHGNKMIGIRENFINNYSFLAFLVMLLIFVSVAFFITRGIKKNSESKLLFTKYRSMFTMSKILLIVYLPPVFQVLVLQQHSAVHEFSMLKFGLPLVLGILVLGTLIMEYKKCLYANIIINIENNTEIKNIKIPAFYLSIIIVLLVLVGLMNQNKSYFNSRIGETVSYEREYLIRDNYNFNDVYFSFTESIEANPPQYLAISKKLIYKIDDFSELLHKFTNLNEYARCLFMVNKNNFGKQESIVEMENNIIEHSKLLFFSENYNVYEFERLNEENNRE